jgi:apolipoprotein N-acyltransferase
MVRATNSGLTALVRPDGAVEVLRVDGRDRMVAGSLAVDLPVPARKEQRTLYLRLREGILLGLAAAPWLLLLLPLAAGAVLRRRRE